MGKHSDFKYRHIGVSEKGIQPLLNACNTTSLENLIQETVPNTIQLKSELSLPTAKNESELLEHLRKLAKKNTVAKSYIGLGYYNCHTPSVILRNIFENPGWYTQYTPYQAEISQGRLELLFHFQTMICELTGMDIANASLLDEATAAAEAMMALYRNRSKEQVKENCNTFLIHQALHPQTINVMKTRATPLGIQVKIGDIDEEFIDNSTFGLLLQYPDTTGLISDHTTLIQDAKSKNVQIAVAADPLSLTLLTPPGEWGADIVIGSTQRFGVPLGFGGPHAAYIASKEALTRQLPGRIIGLSKDRHGNDAYRMALQTREQHIRKEKATSNICTAQALLAIMAGAYAIYHGPEGLKRIAKTIHELTKILFKGLSQSGFNVHNHHFFDTLHIETNDLTDTILKEAETQKINFRKIDQNHIGISLDETSTPNDIDMILSIFKPHSNSSIQINQDIGVPDSYQRKTSFLTQDIFNIHHSETQLMRYLKNLENKDLSLTKSMIPLGSCTMKLNAATEMMPLSWPEFSSIHPFVPLEQAKGYLDIISELEEMLATITGLHGTSLQPNSGAQGEYAGLLVIKAYFEAQNQTNRNLILIPKSAHGTNPASAQMAGFDIKWVNCDEFGNIDINDLKTKAEAHTEYLAGLMITYPSTHGVFEESIQTICKTIHDNGGQVYMDGANMNAQVGLTHPGIIGADVCHLNLHKTFSIPHGGGGPGMGPICVAEHLTPYLPQSPIETPDNIKAGAISAAPWSSASILLISYAYIVMMGTNGLTDASKVAILEANYIASRLQEKYTILFTGNNGRVAHELIIDCRDFKKAAGITVEDIAKRLIDYGFHAPTMSWPVPDTLMIEPTESEDKAELDRFCEAMLTIHDEISEVQSGKEDKLNNVLKNAPHTCKELCANEWPYPYSREKAAVNAEDPSKFWASTGRVDNAYGDRNLVCSCPPITDD